MSRWQTSSSTRRRAGSGARPLKRTMQRLVLDPLSERLLGGDLKKGDEVTVIVKGGAIDFRAG